MDDAGEPNKSENQAVGAGTGDSQKVPGITESLRHPYSGLRTSLASLSGSARIILWSVGAVIGAFVLLWLVDEIVLYYVAKSYVDAIADAFDWNPHLADVFVLLTFLVAFFFFSNLWSFSKRKRLTSSVGLSGLLILHSLLLWLATRDQVIDRKGVALQCYVLSRKCCDLRPPSRHRPRDGTRMQAGEARAGRATSSIRGW